VACTDDGGPRSERTGRPAAMMKAEVRGVFFKPGQPRTRRIFLRDEKGHRLRRRVARGVDIKWVKVE
jgi:hypothetical protein